MKALIYRIVGQPPGKGAPQLDQLRWVRRLLFRWTAPTMALGCIVLILAGVYLAAAILAALEILSLFSVSVRLHRAERQQQE